MGRREEGGKGVMMGREKRKEKTGGMEGGKRREGEREMYNERDE